jgi:acetyl-CoA carboxylase carboxyl transferase alpha subunit/acetyl-CoA carboxylase carboxyl transferase beta subunit
MRIWQPIGADSDPLSFVDTRAYPDRIADARAHTGMHEAVLCARGTVQRYPVVTAVMDFRFLGGSLGSAVGEAVTTACETALRERTPLLLVTASGGARMQEGAIALMQMAKTSQALAQLDEAGILTVSLITDPTFGGVAASFATLCDVVVAEPGARLGFAGPRVIEQTIHQSLPPGFQTAEFLLERGMLDAVVPRSELRVMLGRLLSGASGLAEGSRSGNGRPLPCRRTSAETVVRDARQLPVRNPWDVVRVARRLGRPTTLDYIAHMVENFTELHGDRLAGDCPALVCGLGRIDDVPVAVLGTQKGHTAAELAERGYGMPSPGGYRKAARVMRLAAKLRLPVVTLVDTAGAYPGISAEEQGQSVAIAENLRLMTGLPVPVIAVITGEGGSGGALALAVANRVLMCSNAVYSVISPEGCASILWRDRANASRAAEALRVDARALLELGVIDGVVAEPDGGADTNYVAAAAALRRAITAELAELIGEPAAQLIAHRRARFRAFGTTSSPPTTTRTGNGDKRST